MIDSLYKKEILIVKNYPKIDATSERVGFPMGERFLGYGLVTGKNIPCLSYINYKIVKIKVNKIKIWIMNAGNIDELYSIQAFIDSKI